MTTLYVILALALLVCIAVLAVHASGGDIRLIDDWKRAWKYYSTWALVVLGALPDIYNAIVASGLLDSTDVPDQFTWTARLVALAGLIMRLIRQYRPPLPADDGEARERGG